MEAPETRFALSSRGDRVAYQVIGSGPVDVLVARSSVFSIESMWDEPRLVHFLSQLSAFSRHIWFDFRGTGASDAIAPTESRLLESMVDDMVAVVDAVGCDRALVLVLGAPAGLVFAATRPERTASVAIVNTVARYRRADDYPEGLSDELVEERLSAASLPTAAIVAPSLVSDVPFTRWLGRASRLMVPPNERRVRLRALYDHDVRGVLGSVQAPALVIYGRDTADADRYRFVGEHIPGARLVEVAGGDPFPIADSGPILELIEEFATGGLSAPVSDRALATVLFTDLVSSTEQVSEVGDRRWRNLMEAHDALVRSEVDRLQGKVIRFTGDGVLATFDGPARAIRCACRDPRRARALSVWSSAPGCTPVRSTCTAMMCQGSRCTSVSASASMPDREKCSCRAPSPTSSRDPTSNSRTRVSTS